MLNLIKSTELKPECGALRLDREPLPQKRQLSRGRFPALVLSGLAVFAVCGCHGPRVSQQRLVSQPSMLFSDSLPLNFSSRLIPQLETGAAGAGGAANSGCTACR